MNYKFKNWTITSFNENKSDSQQQHQEEEEEEEDKRNYHYCKGIKIYIIQNMVSY